MITSIVAKTGYKIQHTTLRTLFELYYSRKLVSYSTWFQRLLQKSKWTADTNLRARSYLYRLFVSGSQSKSTFTILDINLVLDQLELKISNISTDDNVKYDIYKMMYNDISKLKEKGAMFISLDGQNRLEYSILPFFLSTLDWSKKDEITKEPLKVTFKSDDGSTISKERLIYNDLAEDYKQVIDNKTVILAIGNEGDVDEFIEDLIDDNSGITWNEFERNSNKLYTACFLVNEAFSGKEPEMITVMDKVGKLDGNYHVEKKGHLKIIFELMNYHLTNGQLQIEFDKMFDESNRKKIIEAFDKVTSFFRTLAKQFPINLKTNKVFYSKEQLRNFYMVYDMLINGDCGVVVKPQQFLKMKELFDRYNKFELDKRDHKKNKGEFELVGKQYKPKPGSFVWSQKSITRDAMKVRQSVLNSWIIENISEWQKDQLFSKNVINNVDEFTKRKLKTSKIEDPYNAFGTPLDVYQDDIHIDHINKLSDLGSNEESNLVATSAVSNLRRTKGTKLA